MIEEIIKAQRDNHLTVNYNQWIFDNIRLYIGSRILDVGAGLGNFLGYLLDKDSVIAIDTLNFFIEELTKVYGLYKNIHIFKCDIQDDRIVQTIQRYNIDTVICNNVLEHVQDDLRALKNIYKILKNQGNLILVLPAFKFLYSQWDKSIGHFRRYGFNDIKYKLTETNFLITSHFYMNTIGFFAWFINGKILRNTPTKNKLVEKQAVFFDRFMVMPLKKIEKLFKPPFGQSLVVIAKPIKN